MSISFLKFHFLKKKFFFKIEHSFSLKHLVSNLHWNRNVKHMSLIFRFLKPLISKRQENRLKYLVFDPIRFIFRWLSVNLYLLTDFPKKEVMQFVCVNIFFNNCSPIFFQRMLRFWFLLLLLLLERSLLYGGPVLKIFLIRTW